MHRQCVLLCMVISFAKGPRFVVGGKVNLAHSYTNCIKIVNTRDGNVTHTHTKKKVTQLH